MPQDRNLTAELGGILQQLPQISAAGPASLNTTLYGTDGTGGLLDILQRLNPSIDSLNARSASLQRESDLGDVAGLSDRYSTLKRQLNPELYGLLGQLSNPSGGEGYLSDITGRLSQPDQLESGLYDQATRMLGSGGALTPQELYQIEQDTRGAYAGRGLYDSNSAIGAEILNKDSARRQRLFENADFASGVSQLRTGRLNTAGGLAAGLAGATNARLGTAAGLGAATYADPYSLLGRSPTNATTSAGLLGQMPDYLSGLLGYGSDLYNTNYNAASSAEIAAGNNAAAKSAAKTGAAGALGGAAITGITALAIF